MIHRSFLRIMIDHMYVQFQIQYTFSMSISGSFRGINSEKQTWQWRSSHALMAADTVISFETAISHQIYWMQKEIEVTII